MTLEELSAEEVRPLRTAVLRPHFEDGRLAEFDGDEDNDTYHFGLVSDQGEIVGVLSFMARKAPGDLGDSAVQLRGMAIQEGRRGEGLGSRLLQGALTRMAVVEPQVEIVWCRARVSAAGFYEEHGFERHGDVFDVPEIGPHVIMWRELPVAIAG